MSELLDAIVAGHIALDITPLMLPGATSLSDIFRAGKLNIVGPATLSTGGAVSNVGLVLRRLGASVKLMGKCGDDMFGRAIVEIIRNEAPGAEAGMQLAAGEQTSYTVVVSPPGIDRVFLHCPGANDTFGAADVDLDAVSQARLLHFGYPPLMARTYADGGAELAQIFSGVKDAGATTSLDMALPDPSEGGGKADWPAILDKTLPYVDVFLPSVEELTFMLRRGTFDEMVAAADGGDPLTQVDGDLLDDLANRCIEAGVAIVVIKCGHFGLYVRTAGRGRLEKLGRAQCGNLDNWTYRELFEPSYVVGNVVSATGSGDSAIAGFLAGLLNGCDVDDCLRYGCAAGGQNVQVAGAVDGIRSWEETTAEVRDGGAKVQVDIPLPRFRYDESASHYIGPSDGKA